MHTLQRSCARSDRTHLWPAAAGAAAGCAAQEAAGGRRAAWKSSETASTSRLPRHGRNSRCRFSSAPSRKVTVRSSSDRAYSTLELCAAACLCRGYCCGGRWMLPCERTAASGAGARLEDTAASGAGGGWCCWRGTGGGCCDAGNEGRGESSSAQGPGADVSADADLS